MKRNDKFYEKKEMRRLFEEYSKRWKERHQHGEWVKVDPPYQLGWIRYYDLRYDISRRSDAPRIREALSLVNTRMYCKREDFTTHDRFKKKRVPIQQPLKFISKKKYDELSPEIQKYLEKRTYRSKKWGRIEQQIGYTLKHSFWVVFVKEPNMVTEQWVPDPKWESRMSEISNRINRDNLWPKINKALGFSTNGSYREYPPSVWLRNKHGEFLSTAFEQEDIE